MRNLIGREKEINFLQLIWEAKEAEFVALYGRRRVGKTYLVREFFSKKGIYIEFTGLKDGSMDDQLRNFTQKISDTFYNAIPLQVPSSWNDAFRLLTQELEKLPRTKKITVFLDELPWLATKRSGLIQNLDYFWNTYWSRLPNLKLIVCGSAASWILDNLINAKGGLYNRITRTLLLRPFTLAETKKFLKSKGAKFNDKQILDIYMVMGGVPHYLKQIKRSKSVAQNINDICFQVEGLLYKEFSKLFASLFDNAEMSLAIVRAIAKNRHGISSGTLGEKIGKHSGGRLNTWLQELEASGFIQRFIPYSRKTRGHYYRVTDEYTLFYLNWIDKLPAQGEWTQPDYWQQVAKTPAWHSWAGYAFESVCYKHIEPIRRALKLNKTICHAGTWRYLPEKKKQDETGAQVDLLFDREDGVITLCEIKYSGKQFLLTKADAKNLINKMDVFEKHISTSKQVNWAMVTTLGLKKNIWSEDLIDATLTLEDLFIGCG